MLPVIGHQELRRRLSAAVRGGTLPRSLLLHGAAGSGKERLALWLAQRILCDRPGDDGEPCGECPQCAYALKGAHPDLHWYFPRPRLKDADPDTDAVIADYAGAIAERVEAKGAWPPPDATDAFYVATVRAVVRRAAFTPAMAQQKVIVIADAERMVSQEGSEEAANTFLKLLEEPAPNTTIILTSNAPQSLLPTIRSRVVSVRVAPVSADERKQLAEAGVRTTADDDAASRAARAVLDAARGTEAARFQAALAQSPAGARGAYSAMLDQLVRQLHEEAREAVANGDERRAAAAARGIALVEEVKQLARQNINPQLLTARLLNNLAPLFS